jgi:hypothetical protein
MKNSQKPYEIVDVTTNNLKNLKKYIPIYKKYGVLIFRNFFNGDKLFDEFYKDVKDLAKTIIKENNLKIDTKLDLSKLITQISKTNRKDVGYLYDLGTRPLKLISGINLKTHQTIVRIIKSLMRNKSILASPYLGETLHIFPPGKENFKHNLPMHQDYPYLMQSPEQITTYINLGKLQPQRNGGIQVWLGSHKAGVVNIKKAKNSLISTKDTKHFIKKYPAENFYFDKGDFAVFNSLLHHRGIQNYSTCTRIVQLIRYSNLLDKKSISFRWRSREGKKKDTIKLNDVHRF